MMKMLCEKCKNKKPTVFFTDAGGVNHSLCAFCASTFNQASAVTQSEAPEIIFSPECIAVSNLTLKLPTTADGEPLCDACRVSGEVRCIPCAQKILKRSTDNEKRMPRRVRAEQKTAQSIAELKGQLSEALAGEDYESAAGIRDRIRKLQAAK